MDTKIKGINLGNWLVLEKWIDPDLFAGTDAEDETYLCRLLDEKQKKERYRTHRDTFITEKDFKDIAAYGFNAVRIPVPYFLFDGKGLFISCEDVLDRAFTWAHRNGLKILLDLHTVPGGQNGTDNSGICGVCTWSTKKEYLNDTLDILEKMAERYGKNEALWGIEVLNEPMCSDTPSAEYLNIEFLSRVYPAREKEAAKDNTNYSLSYLTDFYHHAYRRIRKYMPADRAVVFSDAFYLEGWYEFFSNPEFENIVLDTHQYLTMAEYRFGAERPIEKYEEYLENLRKDLLKVSEKIPVIVGEWSLENRLNGYDIGNAEIKRKMIQRLLHSYNRATDVCLGKFYWTYKLGTDAPEREFWDFRKCVKNKWIQPINKPY